MTTQPLHFLFFFFNDTATTEIYTLSLHDALPIYRIRRNRGAGIASRASGRAGRRDRCSPDRKSTRLNSSHLVISYAVFCLKKKNEANTTLFRVTLLYHRFATYAPTQAHGTTTTAC